MNQLELLAESQHEQVAVDSETAQGVQLADSQDLVTAAEPVFSCRLGCWPRLKNI